MTTTFKVNADGFPEINKSPADVLDYSLDWTDWLAEVADTIDSIVVTSDGITVDSSSKTDTHSTAVVSGGTIGSKPSVTMQITTVGSPVRKSERTVYFNMVQQ